MWHHVADLMLSIVLDFILQFSSNNHIFLNLPIWLEIFSLQSTPFLGLDWSEVSSPLAFSWSFAGMLCWATLLPNDCKTHLHSWTWCYWTSRDCWMAGKFESSYLRSDFLKFHPFSHFYILFEHVCLIRTSFYQLLLSRH